MARTVQLGPSEAEGTPKQQRDREDRENKTTEKARSHDKSNFRECLKNDAKQPLTDAKKIAKVISHQHLPRVQSKEFKTVKDNRVKYRNLPDPQGKAFTLRIDALRGSCAILV